MIDRYRESVKRFYFRGDVAFANPRCTNISKPSRSSTRSGCRPTRSCSARSAICFYASFTYQAQNWNNARRVVVKVEWHPSELYPRVGFIVTNLARPAERVVAFYKQRGTCEQYIKEGKNAIKWTRLSCRTFTANAVRLPLHALPYNLGNFIRTLAMTKTARPWSLTSLREKLIKIGAKVVAHGRYVTFQMAEVAVSRRMFSDILSLIAGSRAPPAPA